MVLNLDPSAIVPIRLRANKSFGFTITFEQDVVGTWNIVFSNDEAGEKPIMELTKDSGFVIAGKVITVFVSAQTNLLKHPCIFRMSQALGNTSVLAFIGSVQVLP